MDPFGLLSLVIDNAERIKDAVAQVRFADRASAALTSAPRRWVTTWNRWLGSRGTYRPAWKTWRTSLSTSATITRRMSSCLLGSTGTWSSSVSRTCLLGLLIGVHESLARLSHSAGALALLTPPTLAGRRLSARRLWAKGRLAWNAGKVAGHLSRTEADIQALLRRFEVSRWAGESSVLTSRRPNGWL
jgi:hypothetical protein